MTGGIFLTVDKEPLLHQMHWSREMGVVRLQYDCGTVECFVSHVGYINVA